VNRTLRQLRERGLVTFREGSVVFHDLAGLRHLAEYHSGYLDQSNGLGLWRSRRPAVRAVSIC
jgi:hypothetical protein